MVLNFACTEKLQIARNSADIIRARTLMDTPGQVRNVSLEFRIAYASLGEFVAGELEVTRGLV